MSNDQAPMTNESGLGRQGIGHCGLVIGRSLQRRQWYVAIAVEYIVGGEWNDMPCGQQMVHARLHQLTNIEVVGVHERRGGYAKYILGYEFFGQGTFKKIFGHGQFSLLELQVRKSLDRSVVIRATTAVATALASKVLADQLPRPLSVERDPARKYIKVVFKIHEPGKRHQIGTTTVGVGQSMGIGMRTRQRRKIGLSPLPGRLLGDARDHIGKRHPLFQLFRQHVTAGVGGGLKANAGDPRSRGTKLHQVTHFMVVYPWL
jgi:hypothetical protein